MIETIPVGDRTRTLLVVGDPDRPAGRALVLVFHGSRQTGSVHRAVTRGQLDALADDDRAVIAYLDGYRGNWNDARRASRFPARLAEIDDVAFARAVVARLHETHGIDVDRVVGVGYSNGGQMVMRLLHEAPDLLAGGVVVAAGLPTPENLLLPSPIPPARPVPVAIVHGTRDPIAPYEGGAMARWAQTLFRVGGLVLSAPATAAHFATRNGIASPPVTETLPAASPARTRVDRTAYRDAGVPPVVLYTIHGGGHTVPGPKAAPRIVGRTNADISVVDMVAGMLEAEGRLRP